jgi:hypothetical protein
MNKSLFPIQSVYSVFHSSIILNGVYLQKYSYQFKQDAENNFLYDINKYISALEGKARKPKQGAVKVLYFSCA